MKASLCFLGLLAVLIVGCGSDSDQKGNANDAATTDAGGASEDTKTKPSENQSQTTTGQAKDAGSAAADSCGSLACGEHAACEEKDGKARCVCAKGFEDVKGDGSECKDIDECDKGESDCEKPARCQNTPGGFECKCPEPGWKSDGKKCSCADGYKEKDGQCVAPDGQKCADNFDCENNHCVGGICCADACSNPGAECLSAEGATCADGKTCKYAVAKDGAACEDDDACTVGSTCKAGQCQKGTEPRNCDDKNPCTDDSCDSKLGCKNQNNTAACDDKNACTQTDVCNAGNCQGTNPKDCSMQADACNKGACDPQSGACKKAPLGDGLACDDGSTCTKTDACKGGSCAGEGNACGPNATACMPGAPNTCTCAASFHASAGLCVPDNDECAQNPCGANADCFDPSNNAGDVTCTCKPDYEGDAKAGCTAKNPCAGNPCGEGRGTCTNGVAGKYTCSCGTGFRAVAGKCVCDMQGTFAVRGELTVSWSGQSGIADGKASQYAWTLQRHNYDDQGNLDVEVIPCGETNTDLCGTGVPLVRIPPEAYSQYVPLAVWDRASASARYNFKLEAPLPGGAFKTPNYATLQGIALDDPLGAWPASRKDVQGDSAFDGSAVNGARWLDTDGDGFFGLTTYPVGPDGAAADGSALAPIEAFGKTSKVCNDLPYNYPPVLDGLSTRRIKRFSSANRVTSAMDGKLDSCDALSGDITGPDNGKVRFDIRIGNCVKVDLNGSNEAACNTSIVDFSDSSQAANKVESDTFKMKRVANTATCKDVRAVTF